MNIFYLDDNPFTCAKYHCDRHIIRVLLEISKILSTIHNILNTTIDVDLLYKPIITKNPHITWLCKSESHYKYVCGLWNGLLLEYTSRYSKIHPCEKLFTLLTTPPLYDGTTYWEDPPQLMPDKYKQQNTIQAYRDFYIGENIIMTQWNRGTSEPYWFWRNTNE